MKISEFLQEQLVNKYVGKTIKTEDGKDFVCLFVECGVSQGCDDLVASFSTHETHNGEMPDDALWLFVYCDGELPEYKDLSDCPTCQGHCEYYMDGLYHCEPCDRYFSLT